MHRIRIIGARNWEFAEPTYLKSYDPDGNDGHGDIELTNISSEAKQFEPGTTMDEWMKISTTRPLRPDGKPNRPLSAYTIQTEPIPENEGSDS
jgi:hypothetical protein